MASVESVRQRRLPSDGTQAFESEVSDDGRRTHGEQIDRTFTTKLLPLAVLLSLLALTTKFWQRIPLNNSSSFEYAVVLDAGSTGSRVLGFTFQRDPETQSLRLLDELWMQVKPGLSAYHDDPSGARAGLEKLLEAAKERVPEEHRSTTPITLKATAGLRLLPKEKSEAIIAEVRDVLLNSGFKPEPNLIEIMNPLDEGMFGWFTVNFLLDQFENVKGGDLSGSHVSLDLGGGSTQITFAPINPNIAGIEGRKHFKHSVNVLGEDYQVYSHSYLGLGLQAARQAVLQLDNGGDVSGGGPVISSCMTTQTPKEWSFQGKTFQISTRSQQQGGSSHELCKQSVKQILADVHRPEEIKSREVAAFSYFFDLAQEHGRVPEGQYDKKVQVGDFRTMAAEACGPAGTGFNCFDLTFAYMLLTEGYGLPDDKTVHLYKKINGHEASWALGLAFNILQKSP